MAVNQAHLVSVECNLWSTLAIRMIANCFVRNRHCTSPDNNEPNRIFKFIFDVHAHDFDVVALVHLLHPIPARGLINQLAKKLI